MGQVTTVHSTPPSVPRKPAPGIVKVCGQCGSTFTAKSESAKWCSTPCTSAAAKVRRKLRERVGEGSLDAGRAEVLRDRLDELPEGELVVHCQAGLRGYLAARVLAQHGRDVVNLDGGYLTWAARPDGAAATPSGDDEDRGSPAG